MSVNITEQEDISNLFRIRRTLLEMLYDRGYVVLNTTEDLNLSRKDFEEQFAANNYNRDSLSILRQRRDDPSQQIYVFFPDETRGKALGVAPISERVDRMTRHGTNRGIFVVQVGLTPQARYVIEQLRYQEGKTTVEVFLENELLVNITKHILVPKHEVLSDMEKLELLKRYKLKESQLPRIQRSDPIARYYGMDPGTVVKITRPSETAGRYITYRFCIG